MTERITGTGRIPVHTRHWPKRSQNFAVLGTCETPHRWSTDCPRAWTTTTPRTRRFVVRLGRRFLALVISR